MAAQGDSTTSVLTPDAPSAGAEVAPEQDAPLTPDSDLEVSDEAPMSFDGSDLKDPSDAGDPGDESDHQDRQDTAEDPEPETPAKPEAKAPEAKATQPIDAAAERAALMAAIRGEKPAETAQTKTDEAPVTPAPKAEAKDAAPADAPTAFESVDPDALVKAFKDEFGADAAKAIAPLAKGYKQLADFATAFKAQQEQQVQAAAAYKVHTFLDTMATDGLESFIGNGKSGQITAEHVKAREDLVDVARVLLTKGQAKDDAEAIRKAALVLFNHTTKKSAVSEVRQSLQQRHQSRTVRPRSSPGMAAQHKPDTSSWGDDDDEVARVKADLKAEGFDV